jgi:ABC-type antimicrobial peptide transport system permease subunit
MPAVEALGLAVSDRGARRAAGVLTLLMVIAAAVGAAVFGVAATSVAHAFFLSVEGRRRDIAVLRAMGATRGDVRGMVVAEAMVVGAVAGAIGMGLAAVAAVMLDRLAASRLSGIPYLPDSLFQMEPWLVACGLAIAIAAAVVGALPAVRRAAARDPASTLSGL